MVPAVDVVNGVSPLQRLLAPRSVAVVGGSAAAEVVRQCRASGFTGPIWAVHPHRPPTDDAMWVHSVADLPQAPDAAFVAVRAQAAVGVVAALAARGAGGAVCYASGFAEVGPDGAELQRRLVEAAGGMALLGPNCYGFVNYLDGAALWPDAHGGRRVERGVAIITQSGNVGLNLTMQRRGLPLAYLVTGGNMAVSGLGELVEAAVADERVSAVGLYIEGIDDVAAFARAMAAAHARSVPVVVLASGRSEAGARVGMTHTSSVATSEALYDTLFARLGAVRVCDLDDLLETLVLLHVHGGLAGRRIASASCSGGEASLVADLAHDYALELPDLGEGARRELGRVLDERVRVANPLDYHTYIWGDRPALTTCFTGLLRAPVDLGLLLLDLPRAERCSRDAWHTALDAFVDAQAATGTPAAVVSTLGECLPEDVADRLVVAGIAPLRGLRTALRAVGAAADVGAAFGREVRPVDGPVPARRGSPAVDVDSACPPTVLDEWQAKRDIGAAGVPVPAGRLLDDPDPARRVDDAVCAASELGHPVVLKALGPGLEHKSERGAVALDLRDQAAVRMAASRLVELGPALLVESMVAEAVAELLVGVRHDPVVGYTLTIAAGGVLVELLRDTATELFPVTSDDVWAALRRLRSWPLLAGHRGRPAADADAVVDAVLAAVRYVVDAGGAVVELDINPLLALPRGKGAVAVDALVVRH